MTAVQCIRKGEEIFNDCGPLPRSDLLRRYGYIVDSHKEWDIVEIETMTILKIVRMVNDLDNTEIDQRVGNAIEHVVIALTFNLGSTGTKMGCVGRFFRPDTAERQ